MSSALKPRSRRRAAGAITVGTRSYLLSQPSAPARGEAVRSHWGIEHQGDWLLDVSFGEDQSRIRQGMAAEQAAMSRWTRRHLYWPCRMYMEVGAGVPSCRERSSPIAT